MFKIYDGREKFYQWDINRKLIVNDNTIKEVHFANCLCANAHICETYTEGNLNIVNVPNILLQEYLNINVYAYDGESTKHSATFEVERRTKPSDYVYTETEVKDWDNAVTREENGAVILTNTATNLAIGNGAIAGGEEIKCSSEYEGQGINGDMRYNEAIGTGSVAIGMGAIAYSRASKSLGYRTQTGAPFNAEELAKRTEAYNNATEIDFTNDIVEKSVRFGESRISGNPPSGASVSFSKYCFRYSWANKDGETALWATYKVKPGNLYFTYEEIVIEEWRDKPFTFDVELFEEDKVVNSYHTEITPQTEDIKFNFNIKNEAILKITINQPEENRHYNGHDTRLEINKPVITVYPLENVGQAAVALGADTVALANNSFAGGYKSIAKGNQSLAFGHTCTATFNGDVALGETAVAAGGKAFAMGESVNALGAQSVVMGNGAEATGAQAVAMGNNTNAGGNYSIALGDTCVTVKDNAFAAGSNSRAEGDTAFAFGMNALAKYRTSIAMGENAQATNTGAIALGTNTNASGLYSVAIGNGAQAKFNTSVAIGRECISNAGNAAALGKGTFAEANGSLVAGLYNEIDKEAMFAIGNGTDADNRKTIFSVNKNGDVDIKGALKFNSVDSASANKIREAQATFDNPNDIKLVGNYNGQLCTQSDGYSNHVFIWIKSAQRWLQLI